MLASHAVEHFEAARLLDPSSVDAMQNLAVSLAKKARRTPEELPDEQDRLYERYAAPLRRSLCV